MIQIPYITNNKGNNSLLDRNQEKVYQRKYFCNHRQNNYNSGHIQINQLSRTYRHETNKEIHPQVNMMKKPLLWPQQDICDLSLIFIGAGFVFPPVGVSCGPVATRIGPAPAATPAPTSAAVPMPVTALVSTVQPSAIPPG